MCFWTFCKLGAVEEREMRVIWREEIGNSFGGNRGSRRSREIEVYVHLGTIVVVLSFAYLTYPHLPHAPPSMLHKRDGKLHIGMLTLILKYGARCQLSTSSSTAYVNP